MDNSPKYRTATIVKSEGGKIDSGAKSKKEIINEHKKSFEVIKSVIG